MSKKQAQRRFRIINPEILDPFLEEKQSLILVLGHYNNWEWGSIAAGLQIRHIPVGLYKPLSNRLIDAYIGRARAKTGTVLVPISRTSRSFEKHLHDPAIFMMVADQSPSNPDRSVWVTFLGQDTATLHGVEKHARQSGLPVLFAAISKVRRGYYEAEFSVLVEDSSSLPYGEITRRFMGAIEKQILEKPEYWLWSHNRWKHRRN